MAAQPQNPIQTALDRYVATMELWPTIREVIEELAAHRQTNNFAQRYRQVNRG